MKTIIYGIVCVMLVQACFTEARHHNGFKSKRQAYGGYGAPAPVQQQQRIKTEAPKFQQTFQQQTFQQQAPVKQQQQSYSAPAPAPLPQIPQLQQQSSYGSFVRQEAPAPAPLPQQSSYGSVVRQEAPAPLPQQSSYGSIVRQPELPREEPTMEAPKQTMDSFQSSFVRQESAPQQSSYGSIVRQPELPREEPIIEAPKQQSYQQFRQPEVIVPEAPKQAPLRQESSYGSIVRQEAPAPLPQQSSYGSIVRQQEQTFTLPKAPLRQETQSSYGSYGQKMEQQLPVRQPLSQSSYGSSSMSALREEVVEPENRCKIGFEQAMWTEDKITSFFCRCPSGTYGITCTENFVNPCVSDDVQYSPADQSLGKHHFIECSNSLPHLFKCAGSLEWNQEKLTCDWPAAFYAALEELVRTYNKEAEIHQQQQQIKTAPIRSQAYGAYPSVL